MAAGYTLTVLADEDFVELKAWSRARWGKELTRQYMVDMHDGAVMLAQNYENLRSRDELAAGSGLSIYPIRKHYVVFHPVAKAHIVIVAVIKQGRDIPGILEQNQTRIVRELKEITKLLKKKKIRLPKRKAHKPSKK